MPNEPLTTVWFYDWKRTRRPAVLFGFQLHAFRDPFGFDIRIKTPFGELRFGKGA